MSLLSRLFGRRPATIRKPSRQRLGCERLETRDMPAVDFVNLGTQLDRALDDVQYLADRALDASAIVLPVAGKSAREFKSGFDAAMDNAQKTIRDAVRVLNPSSQAAAIQTAIADALGRAGILLDRNGNGRADAGDVSVTNLNSGAGTITIDVGLAKSAGVSKPFDFDLGLKGVPLQVTADGRLTASAGVLYESLRFGMQSGNKFFLDTSSQKTIKVTLDAGVTANAQMTATVGLFQVKATPLNANTFGLHAGLAVNPATGAATFFGSANADMKLAGSLTGDSSTAVGGFKYPNVAADFLMNWSLAGSNSNVTAATSLGSTPTLAFKNVQVGFGSFISNVMSPLSSAIQTFLTFHKPYLELVNFKIPGLQEVFETAGLGNASILGIAEKLVNLGVGEKTLFEAIVRYSGLLTNLKTAFGDLMNPTTLSLPQNLVVNLGDFNLSGNGDVRGLQQVTGSSGSGLVSALAPFVTRGAAPLMAQIDTLAGSYPQLATPLAALKAALARMQTEISLTYPFSDDPVNGAFAMLLGRDASLVKFNLNMPSVFNMNLQRIMQAGGLNVARNFPLPVTAYMDGDVNVDLFLSGGYDTKGLRTALQSQNFSGLADGFYFDTSKPLLAVNGKLGVFGGPKIGGFFDFGVGRLGAEAGVQGRGDFAFDNFSLRFDDPNTDGDNRFRPFLSDANRNLFAGTGSVSAQLSLLAYAEADYIIGIQRAELELFKVDLGRFIDFSRINNANPFRPADVSASTGRTEIYDFSARRPDLANGNTAAHLYTLQTSNSLRIMYGSPLAGDGILLEQYPLVNAAGTLTRLVMKGGASGTTFHVNPTLGNGLKYQVIGQGRAETRDILDYMVVDFANDRVNLNVHGADRYGLGTIWATGVKNNAITGESTVEYSRLNGVSVGTWLTKASSVNIAGTVSMPLELNLSEGDDFVTIATSDPNVNLSQSVVLHGNGGRDSLLFRKSVPTGGVLAAPIDQYTIDGNSIRYASETYPERWANGVIDRTPRAETAAIDHYDFEAIDVDEAVRQPVRFDIRGVNAGQTLTVHGTNGVQPPALSPLFATYTVGNDSHTLDGFQGTLSIDDRNGRGVLVLDDSNPNGVGRITNSAQLNASASTSYSVGYDTSRGPGTGVSRTRTIGYFSPSGYVAETRSFAINTPPTLAAMELLAGGGDNDNTFTIQGLVGESTKLVGGNGRDSFNQTRPVTLANTGRRLALIGNGGADSFSSDDSAVADYVNSPASRTHELGYTLTNTSATESTLVRTDRNKESNYDVVRGVMYYTDLIHTDTITLSGIESHTIFGGRGSPNTMTVNGDTSANLTLVGGDRNDMITLGGWSGQGPKGRLYIEGGQGDDAMYLNPGTLDFSELTVWGGRYGTPGENDIVVLVDSQSTVDHTYTVGTSSENFVIRDGKAFTGTAWNLSVVGGSGNDRFELRPNLVNWPGAKTRTVYVGGGDGDDTFSMGGVYTPSWGTSHLGSYTGDIMIEGGAGANTLFVDDSAAISGKSYKLGKANPDTSELTFTTNGRTMARMTGIGGLDLKTAAFTGWSWSPPVGPNSVEVTHVPAGMKVWVTAQERDSVNVGTPVPSPTWWFFMPAGMDMSGIEGTLIIRSTGAGPAVTLDDSAWTGSRNLMIDGTPHWHTVSGYGTGMVSFSGFNPNKVTLLGGGTTSYYVTPRTMTQIKLVSLDGAKQYGLRWV